jgi:hypothetical protein
MARIATGLSKKSNRINHAAFELCLKWRESYGVGVTMDPEFAWVVSGGKFGNKPAEWGQTGNFNYTISEPTINTFKVAHYITVTEGQVK